MFYYYAYTTSKIMININLSIVSRNSLFQNISPQSFPILKWVLLFSKMNSFLRQWCQIIKVKRSIQTDSLKISERWNVFVLYFTSSKRLLTKKFALSTAAWIQRFLELVIRIMHLNYWRIIILHTEFLQD